MPKNGLHGQSVTPAQPSPDSPPTCGRLALEQQIDALWRETRNPKIGLFRMTAIYRRLAELRAQLGDLETSPDEQPNPTN